MHRPAFILALLVLASVSPTWAAESRAVGRSATPRVTVPVQTIRGQNIGCVVVPTPSTRALSGFRKVHAVACVEGTTGEVIVAVLRKNGTLLCSGSGYLDPQNLSCANVNVCGAADYYCLF